MPQRLCRDFKYIAVAPRNRLKDGRSACQMRDIACKLTLPVSDDRPRFIAGIIEDFNFARLDNEELESAIAERDKRFTIPVMFRRQRGAIRRLSDLSFVEYRERD